MSNDVSGKNGPATTVYTIGYGGRKPEDFLDHLRARGIRAIVDVRLQPRAYAAFYTKAKTPDKGIQRLLAAAGIQYFSFVEMGNPFRGQRDWEQQYRRLLDEKGEQLVKPLDRVPEPFCLLCSEKRVAECHRRLIAEFLAARGHRIEHIQ
jgi:uncharacterized protein (DUF488 family)